MQNASTITLSLVFMELLPFQSFAITSFPKHISERESNATWHIERGQWEEHFARTKTLSQVIMQLFPFLIFSLIDFYGDCLRYDLRELTGTPGSGIKGSGRNLNFQRWKVWNFHVNRMILGIVKWFATFLGIFNLRVWYTCTLRT